MWTTAKTVAPKTVESLKQPEAGVRIRRLRELTDLTQEQFAAMLGVSFGTINRWENGYMEPSQFAMHQILALVSELSPLSLRATQNERERLLAQYSSAE